MFRQERSGSTTRCDVTSQQIRDPYAVGITDMDFAEGTLRKPSNVRPNWLFSASTNLILYRAGHGRCIRDACEPVRSARCA